MPIALRKRKSSVTPQVVDQVCRLIAHRRLSLAEAARMCGITPAALHIQKSRKDSIDSAIELARAQSVENALAAVERAFTVDSQGKGPDWRAAAWYAEHVHYEKFGNRGSITMNNCQVVAGLDQDIVSRVRSRAAKLRRPADPKPLPPIVVSEPSEQPKIEQQNTTIDVSPTAPTSSD